MNLVDGKNSSVVRHSFVHHKDTDSLLGKNVCLATFSFHKILFMQG